MNWDWLHQMPLLWAMAFSLICFCDETQSKRVWMILAFHAAANGVLNVFAFGYLEHSLVAVTTVYTSLDVLAVLLISRIPTNIAKGQFALLGVLIIHQWITLAAVNEPLVLAIAICQLLLGYNAIASAIRKFNSALRDDFGSSNPTHSTSHCGKKIVRQP